MVAGLCQFLAHNVGGGGGLTWIACMQLMSTTVH